MKSKNLFLIFIFGLFIFLLPSFVEAACLICCCYNSVTSDCRVHSELGLSERLGIVGMVEETPYYTDDYLCMDCEDSSGKCKAEKFPTGNNGQSCTALDFCQPFIWVCNACIQSGVWDASDPDSGDRPACVSCNGKIEQYIRGDTFAVYAGCSGFPTGCNSPGNTGDGQCESACGASSQCDEAAYGSNVPVLGGVCNNCVFVSNPAIGFSPSSFTFTAGYGGSNPTNQGLQIWNSGPSGSVLRWSVSDNATWLTLSPTSGISTGSSDKGTVWLSVNIAGLTYGNYTATITISDPNASNNPRTVPVTLTIAIPNLQVPSSDIKLGTTDGKVHYTVHNAGNWYTPEAGFYNSLYINGVYTDYQLWGYSLAAGAWTMELVFPNWICTPYQTNSIKVCADERNGASKMVTESNESDNCTTVNLLCPLECTGSIDASPETANAPCDYSIRIYNVDYCQGLTWQVTRDGSSIGSGTVTSSPNWSKTISDNGLGVDNSINYRLYIDGDQKDNDIVICQEGGATGTLSCSSSTASSATLSYSFSNGTNVSLFEGSTLLITFSGSSGSSTYTDSGLSAGTSYTYYLRNGNTTSSTLLDSATCTTQTTPNNPPTCDAGSDKTVNENQTVQLDGSASDPDSDPLTYSWSCTGGSLNNSSVLQPIYTAPSVTADTDYTCTLSVSDGKGGNCSDPMIVHVKDVPAGATIVSPSVITVSATVTKTSATLNGYLNSLGYDTGTCPNCQCIVWFEWGTSGTAGVSGSYGNTTTPIPMNSSGPFTAVISGLTPGQTYKFEAFAKNGGSW